MVAAAVVVAAVVVVVVVHVQGLHLLVNDVAQAVLPVSRQIIQLVSLTTMAWFFTLILKGVVMMMMTGMICGLLLKVGHGDDVKDGDHHHRAVEGVVVVVVVVAER